MNGNCYTEIRARWVKEASVTTRLMMDVEAGALKRVNNFFCLEDGQFRGHPGRGISRQCDRHLLRGGFNILRDGLTCLDCTF